MRRFRRNEKEKKGFNKILKQGKRKNEERANVRQTSRRALYSARVAKKEYETEETGGFDFDFDFFEKKKISCECACEFV